MHDEIGLNFAMTLRSFRQDPDIIMVGVVVTSETAEIAVETPARRVSYRNLDISLDDIRQSMTQALIEPDRRYLRLIWSTALMTDLI